MKNKLMPEVADRNIKNSLYRCHYCNLFPITYQDITVDHKIPLSKGGLNIPKNLVPACRQCNKDKGNKDYDTFMKFK